MTALEMSPAVCEEQPFLVEAVDAEAAALKELEDLKAEMSTSPQADAKADLSKSTPVAQGGRPVATPGSAKRAQVKPVQTSAGVSKKKLTTEEREMQKVESERAEMQKIFDARNKRYQSRGGGVVVAVPPSTPKGKNSADSVANNSSPNSKIGVETGAKVSSSKTPDRKESIRQRCPPEAKALDAKSLDKADTKTLDAKAPAAKVRPQSLGKSLATRQTSPGPSPKAAKPQASDAGKSRQVTAARASTPRGVRSSCLVTSASSPSMRSPSTGPSPCAKISAGSTDSRVARAATPRGATSPRLPASGAAISNASTRASTPGRGARASTPVRSAQRGAVSPKPQPTTQRSSTLMRSGSKGASKASSITADSKVSVHVTVQIDSQALASAEAASAVELLAKDSSATEPTLVSVDVIDGVDTLAISEPSVATPPTTAEGASADAERLSAESEAQPADILPADIPPAEVAQAEVLPAEALPAEIPPAEIPSAEVPPLDAPPAESLQAEVLPVEVPQAEALPAQVQPAEVPLVETLPAEVLPAEVPQAEVLPAEVPIMETPTSESPIVEIESAESAEGPLADTSSAEVLDVDISAEVLDAELPPLETSSAETPSETFVQAEFPIAQGAATELDEVQIAAKLYVHHLVANTLRA